MRLIISDEIRNAAPGYKALVITGDVVNCDTPEDLLGLIDRLSNSFAEHFDGENIAEMIGWNCRYNEAALKVILYHEVLTQIAQILDESGILPIPEVLTAEIPNDEKQTASVGYITLR